MSIEIPTLTLNVFGVKRKGDQKRFAAIAEAIEALPVRPDVCFFQEVIFQRQVRYLEEYLPNHRILWRRGRWGRYPLVAGGLAIAVPKEWPVNKDHTDFRPFTRQRLWTQIITQVDWLLGKGALIVSVRLPGEVSIQLVCTHTVGAYNQSPKLIGLIQAQVDEALQFIDKSIAVLGADLNCTPNQIAIGRLQDALAGRTDCTILNRSNAFRQEKFARALGRGDNHPDKRIDYLLARGGAWTDVQTCLEGGSKPLSDHSAIFGRFCIG